MLDFNDAPSNASPATPLSLALDYARRGWPVIPCNPINKTPLVGRDRDNRGKEIANTGGVKKATTDEFTIRNWWVKWPNAMIGVATGAKAGFWVLDIDTDQSKGKDGIGSLAKIGRSLSELMDTAVARTGSGGYHCLFRQVDGLSNSPGALPPFLDVRGEGGYIIAAGSRLSDGRSYEWLNPPDEIEIAEAPSWLLEIVRGSTKSGEPFDFNSARPNLPNAAERASTIPPGRWHERTRDLVARMCREGASDETIAAIAPGFTEPGYTHAQTLAEFAAHARSARAKWGYQPAAETAAPDQADDVFRLYTIRELAELKPPEWRIDGIFPTHGSSIIYGAFESYKTFVALDMLLALACGADWQGRETKACPVLYVAGEGQAGMALRTAGWCAAKGQDHESIRFLGLPEAIALPNRGNLDKLLRTIERMAEPPGVIAFDTITRMSGGGSLNDEKDVQAYVQASDRLRIATGAHIMHVGHSGKDREKGLMGSIVLPAAMETIICVERKGDSLTLVNSNPRGKQKDGPNFEDIRLCTRKVEFAHQGGHQTTLIIMPDDEVVGTKDKPAAQRLGPLQQKIVSALEQAARGGRSSLGFISLKSMTGMTDHGNLAGALRKLVEKGAVEVVGDEGNQQWKLP